MDKKQAINIVRKYKEVISSEFGNARVFLYGSYSKGNARKDSDIDVAVVVPTIQGNWLTQSSKLWHEVDKVSFLIEPVLIAEDQPSLLYQDILTTGVEV